MKEIIFNLILIATIAVNIVDISGVIPNIEKQIARWLHTRSVHIHLIECSYCVTHWLCLFYLICTHNLTLTTYTLTLIVAFLTTTIKDICYMVKDILTKVTDMIYKKLKL